MKIKKLLKYLNFKVNPDIALLHCPKTGGTYVCQHEGTQSPVISNLINYGHTFVVSDYNEFNPFYRYSDHHLNPITLAGNLQYKVILSIVRNHFDWLVSYYYHSGGDRNNKYYNPNHYDASISEKGFEYLIKTICNRDDVWPNKKFIFRQNFTSDGKLLPHYIARTSTLDSDLEEFAKIYNLDYQKMKRQRVGRNESESYKKYFNDELIELVNKTFEDEMNLYGFDFDGDRNGVLKRIITPQNRSEIFYNSIDNKLINKRR